MSKAKLLNWQFVKPMAVAVATMTITVLIIVGIVNCATHSPSNQLAKQFPQYSTVVRYEFNDTIWTYYVRPDAGWEIVNGTLTMTDYIFFDKQAVYNQGQKLVLSDGIGWYMKADARDEVK